MELANMYMHTSEVYNSHVNPLTNNKIFNIAYPSIQSRIDNM